MSFIPQHVIDRLAELRTLGANIRTNGTVNLDLRQKEFYAFTLIEHDGYQLLQTLEGGAWREAESMELITARREADGIHYRVPVWDSLLSFLRTVKGGSSGHEQGAGSQRGGADRQSTSSSGPGGTGVDDPATVPQVSR